MPFVKSCVESEQTDLVSSSLIPVPYLICIAFYAVLFKRTSYLEEGRVIIRSKTFVKKPITVIKCGKQGLNDPWVAKSTYNANELRFLEDYVQPRCYVMYVMTNLRHQYRNSYRMTTNEDI